jgi:hypothetical protein
LERGTAEKRPNDGAVVRAAAAQRIGPPVHKDAYLGLAVSEPLLHQKTPRIAVPPPNTPKLAENS